MSEVILFLFALAAVGLMLGLVFGIAALERLRGRRSPARWPQDRPPAS